MDVCVRDPGQVADRAAAPARPPCPASHAGNRAAPAARWMRGALGATRDCGESRVERRVEVIGGRRARRSPPARRRWPRPVALASSASSPAACRASAADIVRCVAGREAAAGDSAARRTSAICCWTLCASSRRPAASSAAARPVSASMFVGSPSRAWSYAASDSSGVAQAQLHAAHGDVRQRTVRGKLGRGRVVAQRLGESPRRGLLVAELQRLAVLRRRRHPSMQVCRIAPNPAQSPHRTRRQVLTRQRLCD